MSSLKDNPFAALFNNVEEARDYVSSQKHNMVALSSQSLDPSQQTIDVDKEAKDKIKINEIIEEVFLITLDNEPSVGRPSRCVFLSELRMSLKDQDWLDLDCLEQAVFERLMLESPGDHVITTHGTLPDPQAAARASESNVLRYLLQCFVRLQNSKNTTYRNGLVYDKCKHVIILNGKTCFMHQDIFANLNTPKEFIDLFVDEYNSRDSYHMINFFGDILVGIDEERISDTEMPLYEGSALFDALGPILNLIHKKIQAEVKLGHQTGLIYCDIILFFSKIKCTAEALLHHITPKTANNGKAYEHTLIGSILSLSCIPQNLLTPPEFFDKPSGVSKHEHDGTEATIHKAVEVLNEKVYQIMYNMLKLGGDVKHQLLQWIGNLLHANVGRAKLWTRQMAGVMDLSGTYCSDGFFINLCAVMLRLSKPFSEPYSLKLLKVQPTYCAATSVQSEQLREKNIHMKELANETSLVPVPEGENDLIPLEDNYNFLSECFHMTHFCLHLGFHVAHERFIKLNQELHRVQSAYRDVAAQGMENSDPGQRLKENMEKGMTLFLSLKASLSEMKLLEHCFNFNVATATYLIQLSTIGYGQSQFEPVKFPLSENAPKVMCCIPEFVAENIVDYMLFTRRFKDSMYEMMGEKLNPLLTFILTFMGSAERMKNPHLRAHLAEGLEALMPPRDNRNTLISSLYRENLFKTHPHIRQLAITLMKVFVSIEMTGQGVEFEQKFNYRRPMYKILEFLWEKPIHKDVIKELSKEALQHMEDLSAPLFLRFINLLINDAIFLLDEALSYMSQIKEKQKEQDAGAWKDMTPPQQQEAESNLRQVEMLARFHNIMGNETINTIEMFTQEIKDIFTHDVMVDRIADMLNYFLLHLVGPKQKDLKVRDADKVDFKPHDLVSKICQLYLNLGENEKFCTAVSKDGRSYSHELFVKAESVLKKIHRPADMIMGLHNIGQKVKGMAEAQQAEDEAAEDAPEEFLDPIMGTLMKDPVLLPTSGNIMDRIHIARHILRKFPVYSLLALLKALSNAYAAEEAVKILWFHNPRHHDQFDPFNRAPLTMDMVKPEDELREKILKWLEDKKEQKRRENKQ